MNYIEIAKNVFRTEIRGINAVLDGLGSEFADAIELISATRGRVIVCGMGKSGIIGKKISATFASTGTQSYFMHPGEAFHGDLGMVDQHDVFIGISYSGETDELLKLLPFLRRNGNKLVAITGKAESTMAKSADIHLCVSVPEEACPLQLAPTASTTATLVMGDALAVALMNKKEFKEKDFAVFHPGGALGRRLLSKVSDEMLTKDLPLISKDSEFSEILTQITSARMGLAIVNYGSGGYGIITDGDLRRGLELYGVELLNMKAHSLASEKAISISPDSLVSDAWNLMEEKKVTALLVLNKQNLVGVLKK